MARLAGKKPQRVKSGLLTKLLLLLLLLGIGMQLSALRQRVEQAKQDREALAVQVAALQRENELLQSDIALGRSQKKMEEIARYELGLVTPNEYVFYDVSN